MKGHLLAIPIGDIANDPENYGTNDVGRARQSDTKCLEGCEIVLHTKLATVDSLVRDLPKIVADAVREASPGRER